MRKISFPGQKLKMDRIPEDAGREHNYLKNRYVRGGLLKRIKQVKQPKGYPALYGTES